MCPDKIFSATLTAGVSSRKNDRPPWPHGVDLRPEFPAGRFYIRFILYETCLIYTDAAMLSDIPYIGGGGRLRLAPH
jgi:hypothetical protein